MIYKLFFMRNIKPYEEWVSESKTKTTYSSDKKTVKVDGKKYAVDDSGEVEEITDDGERIDIEDKTVKKYANRTADAAEELKDAKRSYDIERKSGEVPDLKNGIRELDKGGYSITSDDSIKDILDGLREFEWKYVELDGKYDRKTINRIFSLYTKSVGKGEVLLPSIYGDVKRKNPMDSGKEGKGDNKTIEDDGGECVDIEVKSGGASFSVPSETLVKSPEYTCAYSIAKYICSRNLGKIYLAIFDNDVEKDKIDNKKVSQENSEEQSNKIGEHKTNGFLLMNCGESMSPNRGDTKKNADVLATKMLQKDLINVVRLENKRKENRKFTIRYEGGNDGKIICMVNHGFIKEWTPGSGK